MARGGEARPWPTPRSRSHAEFGRDSSPSFRRNADLDPKFQECSPNLSFSQGDLASCAGLERHENMHKGRWKVVGTLR